MANNFGRPCTGMYYVPAEYHYVKNDIGANVKTIVDGTGKLKSVHGTFTEWVTIMEESGSTASNVVSELYAIVEAPIDSIESKVVLVRYDRLIFLPF